MAKIIHRSAERSYETLLDLSVELNLLFYQSAAKGGMVYRADLSRRDTRYAIEQVRRDKTKRKKIRRIAERFPHDWPLHGQAAYLLRAFSGLQIFPDANHRTGLAILREHLHAHGRHFDLQGEPLAKFITELRSLKGPYSSRCNAGQLHDRNRSLLYIERMIQDHTRPFTLRERTGRWLVWIPGSPGSHWSPPLITPYPVEAELDEHHRKT